MKKILLFSGVIIAIFALLALITTHQQKEKTEGNPYGKDQLDAATIDVLDDPEYQNIITPDGLEDKLKEEKDVYVYFFSPTCPYCQKATPVVNDVMDANDVHMNKYNLLEFVEGWNKYGIQGTPTLIHYVDGKEVSRIEGGREESEYNAWVKQTKKQSN